MEKSTKKSFATSYPFVYDALCIAFGITIAAAGMYAWNNHVMPKLTAAAGSEKK
jgi:hypothetical protein